MASKWPFQRQKQGFKEAHVEGETALHAWTCLAHNPPVPQRGILTQIRQGSAPVALSGQKALWVGTGNNGRESTWAQSIAVGNKEFVEKT